VGIACENSSQPDNNEADTDYDDDDNEDEGPTDPKRSKVIVP